MIDYNKLYSNVNWTKWYNQLNKHNLMKHYRLKYNHSINNKYIHHKNIPCKLILTHSGADIFSSWNYQYYKPLYELKENPKPNPVLSDTSDVPLPVYNHSTYRKGDNKQLEYNIYKWSNDKYVPGDKSNRTSHKKQLTNHLNNTDALKDVKETLPNIKKIMFYLEDIIYNMEWKRTNRYGSRTKQCIMIYYLIAKALDIDVKGISNSRYWKRYRITISECNKYRTLLNKMEIEARGFKII